MQFELFYNKYLTYINILQTSTLIAILKEQFGTSPDGMIDIILSRQDLASFAGATYETVFRVINELTLVNLVQTNGKSIRILNEEGLRKLTELQNQ